MNTSSVSRQPAHLRTAEALSSREARVVIDTELQLKQAIEQIQGMCRAIETLRAAVLAEGPVDEIRKFQADIDDYVSRLEKVAS
jgi:hypothetical protein